jgi:hypothetical protein
LSSTSEPGFRADAGLVGQLLAGTGATLALLGAITFALPAVGVALLVAGVIIAAPFASDPGPYLEDWWTVLGVATLVCLTGIGLWFVSTVAGGILITAGAILALVAVALGVRFPGRR